MTAINTDNPLFNTAGERLRLQGVLRHLGSGADLRDLPASPSEKVALVKTANQRGLIAWHKARGRYELTSAGWCELAPSRRFGAGSMMLGTMVGATLGAAVLAVFWFAADTAHGPVAPRPVVAAASAKVAKAPPPAVTGAVNSAAPVAPASTFAAAPTTPTSAPAVAPPAAPDAAPVEPEPTQVAHEPTPEQRAAAARAKQAAAAKKARQRAAARRKREEAARAWAATYGGYGGQSSWYAYR